MTNAAIRCVPSALLAIVGVLAVLFAQPARSFKIMWPDDVRAFEPEGEVDRNGHHVRVALRSESVAECTPGDIQEVAVVVFQEETGALAEGRWMDMCALGHRPGLWVDAHLVRGTAPFEEGPAVASASAVIRRQGAIVRRWSWTSDVLLVDESD